MYKEYWLYYVEKLQMQKILGILGGKIIGNTDGKGKGDWGVEF